jgi:hypothetical protein
MCWALENKRSLEADEIIAIIDIVRRRYMPDVDDGLKSERTAANRQAVDLATGKTSGKPRKYSPTSDMDRPWSMLA